MSHYIPVLFFPIKKSELPIEVTGWKSVLPLIESGLANRAETGLRESSSRNWWHQHALSLIAADLAITGLDFIQAEVACLEKDALQAAKLGLSSVLDQVQDGIPNLSPTSEGTGTIEGLRQYYDGDDVRRFSVDMYRQAFAEAQPVSEISGMNDVGYKSLVDFFAFIKSLHSAIDECLGQNKCLLYVQIH